MVGHSQALQPSGPRFYDLNGGGLKSLHRWGDEWWVVRRHPDGDWVTERKLTIEDAVKIVVAAEKKYQPGRLDRLEQAIQEFIGDLISTFAADSLNWLQIGEPRFAEECMGHSLTVRNMAIERGLLEVAQLKPPEKGSGELPKP